MIPVKRLSFSLLYLTPFNLLGDDNYQCSLREIALYSPTDGILRFACRWTPMNGEPK